MYAERANEAIACETNAEQHLSLGSPCILAFIAARCAITDWPTGKAKAGGRSGTATNHTSEPG